MIEELAYMVPNFAVGVATPLFLLGSPTEWAVHRYLLHPETRNFLNRASAIGHHDKHHGAYNGPEHYYRDITNEHEVIHFSPSDVLKILGSAAIVGAGLDRARSLVDPQPFGAKNLAFIGGVLAGTGAYYITYEFTHHYMHVIGQRRLAINRSFGAHLQEQPDGNLRGSKPLLDDICNVVERKADGETCSFGPKLISRVEELIKYNTSELHYNRVGKIRVDVEPTDAEDILVQVAQEMQDREKLLCAGKTWWQRKKYGFGRFIQRQLRSSPVFQFLDNNHYMHHYKYRKNLNVVFPLADIVLGTKADSSRKFLEENKAYWLCPNSPDTKKFALEETVAER